MPVFRMHFAGLANNRKLTDEFLIRAIRIAAEGYFEAVQFHMHISAPLKTNAPRKYSKALPMKNVYPWVSL